jgi:hypothetical protein
LLLNLDTNRYKNYVNNLNTKRREMMLIKISPIFILVLFNLHSIQMKEIYTSTSTSTSTPTFNATTFKNDNQIVNQNSNPLRIGFVPFYYLTNLFIDNTLKLNIPNGKKICLNSNQLLKIIFNLL